MSGLVSDTVHFGQQSGGEASVIHVCVCYDEAGLRDCVQHNALVRLDIICEEDNLRPHIIDRLVNLDVIPHLLCGQAPAELHMVLGCVECSGDSEHHVQVFTVSDCAAVRVKN